MLYLYFGSGLAPMAIINNISYAKIVNSLSPHHSVPSHRAWRPPRLSEWDERDSLSHGRGKALRHTDAALDRSASSQRPLDRGTGQGVRRGTRWGEEVYYLHQYRRDFCHHRWCPIRSGLRKG